MGIQIAIIIIAVTAISYWHVIYFFNSGQTTFYLIQFAIGFHEFIVDIVFEAGVALIGAAITAYL